MCWPAYDADGSLPASPEPDHSRAVGAALAGRQPGTRAGQKAATEGPQNRKTGERVVTGVAVPQFLAADWGQQEGGSCAPGVDAPAEGGVGQPR